MATKFYIRNTTQTTPISPSADAGWEVTSNLVRSLARLAKSSDTLTTIAITEATSTDKDILVRQLITPIAGGQTITNGQTIKFQCRVSETGAGNNMFLALGVRVIALDGSTIRATILPVTRDNVEAATSLTNRAFTAIATAGYTTVDGDYLVLELGMGGDPTGSNPHDFSMRLGDSAATDLAEDDATAADNNPWISLNDTLSVGVSTAAGSASGLSTVAGVLRGIANGVGFSSATSSVNGFITGGVPPSTQSRDGSASGQVTATAIALSQAVAAGQSVCATLVDGVSSGAGGGVATPLGSRLRFAYELFDDDAHVIAALPGVTGAGSAIATSSVTGVSAASKTTAGSAAGHATVVGHSPSITITGSRLRFAYELFDDDVFSRTVTGQQTTGLSSATSTVVGFGAIVRTTTGLASGFVTVLGAFGVQGIAIASATAIGDASGVIKAIAISIANAVATTSVNGVGAFRFSVIGNAAATSVVTGVGGSTTENQGIGISISSSVVVGFAVSVAEAAASSVATSTALATMRATSVTVGVATATSSALGLSVIAASGTGIASATSVASAFSQAAAGSEGIAAGVVTVLAFTGAAIRATGISSVSAVALAFSNSVVAIVGSCSIESEVKAHGRRPGASDDVPKNVTTLAQITSKTTTVRDLTLTPTRSKLD